jgi:hypothetical protein
MFILLAVVQGNAQLGTTIAYKRPGDFHIRIQKSNEPVEQEFQGIPGKWYVSFPSYRRPGGKPLGGPFDTEETAREWVKCVLSTLRGGIIWQCHERGGQSPAAEPE